ncbi:MAG: hypothetical protein EXQ95_14945 [Alphaproteobacteria bacterium]|nr:hypothetical protein [Alphaproteobacteria bacterium]
MTFETIRTIGWRTVELALMAVVFCLLAYILLGDASGSFVHAVAMNAIQFSQDVPTGTLVGFALIAFLYWFLKSRRD